MKGIVKPYTRRYQLEEFGLGFMRLALATRAPLVPVAVIGASTGLFGAVWAQAETRKVLGIIGADVIENELPVGQADAAFAENGQLVEPEQRAVLAELVGVLLLRAAAGREAQAA